MEKLIRRAFFLYPSYHLSMRAKDERLMTSVWMGVYPKWKNKAFQGRDYIMAAQLNQVYDMTLQKRDVNLAEIQICPNIREKNLKIQEVRRCVALGMKGFEIGSHVGEKSLDHKDFWPLYKVN